jgi:hypothetical protein
MGAVGKILVFLNLIFSVVTSGLIVMVFTTRTSWKAEFEKVKNVALVAEAAYKSEKLARDNDLRSRDSQIKSLAEEKGVLTSQHADDAKAIADLRKDVSKAQADNATQVATNTALSNELGSLKSERDTLTKQAVALRNKNIEQQKEINDQKQIATNNKIEADAQTAKAQRLLNRVEELERNNTQLTSRLNALGGGGAGGSSSSILNPPPTPAPRDVKGTVRAVGTTGLTVVNLGSDSGISAGNKLEVYRVDADNPARSVYLGELVISRTEPKQAVGQFYPKNVARPDQRLPKVGDIVSTTLGSGNSSNR